MNQQLCYNCFQEHVGSGSCPCCGYDSSTDQGKYPFALPYGSILAGQYITGRVLGQGGFGITYLAQDRKLDAKVAIKEFLPDSMAVRTTGDHQVTIYTGQRQENFQYGMERFLDEARVLAKFQGNPNIVGVRSYFEENGTAYFVMDYIEGESFKTYIQNQGGKVPWQDAVRILTPVMEALGAVHKEGIIHRDVTPDNIILTSDGGVKLLDFGSARYSLGDKSKSLDVVLKAGYAPKEQYLRRGKQGPYTDVYSLAACFYAAITGYLPPEALERMDEDELVPPSTRGVKLPSGLEDVILKGLEVQPASRYQSMEEFHAALEIALIEPDGGDKGIPPEPVVGGDKGIPPKPGEDRSSIPHKTFLTRVKALPIAAKSSIAAVACLVLIMGAVAGSKVLSAERPTPIDAGGNAQIQNSGDTQRTAQDGGIGQLASPGTDTPKEDITRTDGIDASEKPPQETQPVHDSETLSDVEKAAAEKVAVEKAAAEKAAAEKAAAEKAAAEKAAAEKAAAEKAAAEKAAAEKAVAEKTAAEKAAAEKAAAEAAAAVTKVTNQSYTMVTSKFSVSGTYTGEWKDGKPNGEGTMTMSQSDDRWDKGDTLYSANWADGLIEGYGQWRSAVDGAYDGNFSKGLKSGKGKMWFSDGTVFDGQWSAGDFVG